MIRYMGGLGQSSDRSLPSFDVDGLPLVPELIEVITPTSSARGERHAGLSDHVGEVAVRSWLGNPEDPSETSGVGWLLATPLARATRRGCQRQWRPFSKPTPRGRGWIPERSRGGAALTSPTRFSETTDTGWNSPATGVHVCYVKSGQTLSTYAYQAGGAATDHNEVAIELDAAAFRATTHGPAERMQQIRSSGMAGLRRK